MVPEGFAAPYILADVAAACLNKGVVAVAPAPRNAEIGDEPKVVVSGEGKPLRLCRGEIPDGAVSWEVAFGELWDGVQPFRPLRGRVAVALAACEMARS